MVQRKIPRNGIEVCEFVYCACLYPFGAKENPNKRELKGELELFVVGLLIIGAKENPKKRELKVNLKPSILCHAIPSVQRKIPRNGN